MDETQDWEGKQLDKDLRIKDNKLYSPSTCIFVSARINTILLDNKLTQGQFLLGVHWSKVANKYTAQCSNGISRIYLGCFNLELEAHTVYMNYKKQLIIDIANQQHDLVLREILLTRSKDYEI